MLQYYEPQRDFGTPPSTADEVVRLTIDGIEVRVPAGTSVMRAAQECGNSIPKLCATDSLEPFGSCRMCQVEVKQGEMPPRVVVGSCGPSWPGPLPGCARRSGRASPPASPTFGGIAP